MSVTVAGGGTVTVPAGGAEQTVITDNYTLNPGSLVVSKTIAGPAAGQQGQVVIQVVCGGTALTPDLTIPAGTAAGSTSHTYTDIPAGTECTATETADGHTSTVAVQVTGDNGTPMTIPAGGTATAAITDTYTPLFGSLVVTKTIAGAAAGLQGAVTIHVVCGGTALTPDLTIPAGTAAGSTSHTYTDIPAGTECTATETADGHTSTVAVQVTGDNGTPMTIPAGGTATAAITDTYTDISGQLIVNKEITGNGAGRQGPITIHVVCGGTPLTPDFTIPAGAESTSHTYTGLAPGAVCTVSETVDGSIPDVVTAAVPVIDQPDPILANGSVEATVRDTYTLVTGSFQVTKTIAGGVPDGAGQQGDVTIQVVCGGTALTPDLSIPAGTAAGSTSQTYTDIPAGTECTATETFDGHTTAVSVVVSGDNGTPVTIPANGTAKAAITDTYTLVPGSLVVTKTIAGSAAGQQGDITIQVVCGGTALTPNFTIDGGSPAGSTSQTYTDIPAGQRCVVFEIADGRTRTVAVTVTGRVQTTTIPAGDETSVTITDTYTLRPGGIIVGKILAGRSPGSRARSPSV